MFLFCFRHKPCRVSCWLLHHFISASFIRAFTLYGQKGEDGLRHKHPFSRTHTHTLPRCPGLFHLELHSWRTPCRAERGLVGQAALVSWPSTPFVFSYVRLPDHTCACSFRHTFIATGAHYDVTVYRFIQVQC